MLALLWPCAAVFEDMPNVERLLPGDTMLLLGGLLLLLKKRLREPQVEPPVLGSYSVPWPACMVCAAALPSGSMLLLLWLLITLTPLTPRDSKSVLPAAPLLLASLLVGASAAAAEVTKLAASADPIRKTPVLLWLSSVRAGPVGAGEAGLHGAGADAAVVLLWGDCGCEALSCCRWSCRACCGLLALRSSGRLH